MEAGFSDRRAANLNRSLTSITIFLLIHPKRERPR
jgi:hypothetical protein